MLGIFLDMRSKKTDRVAVLEKDNLQMKYDRIRGTNTMSVQSDVYNCCYLLLQRSPVEKVSVICFNVMIRIGICKTPVRTYDVGAPSAITISLPGMSPSDAERRR